MKVSDNYFLNKQMKKKKRSSINAKTKLYLSITCLLWLFAQDHQAEDATKIEHFY